MHKIYTTPQYLSWLQVLNHPQHSGRFDITTQFPHYKEILYKPDFRGRRLGKNVVFDMDMSAGDFLALFYLLKLPVETINLKVHQPFAFTVPLQVIDYVVYVAQARLIQEL